MLNSVTLPLVRFRSPLALAAISAPPVSRIHSLESEPADCNVAAVKRAVKLLLISADEGLCILVRSYLRHLGFSVFTCTSADRAESLFLERCDIDVWLIDVHSLGIEAMYFATRVRSVHPEIPIVLVAGQRIENNMQRRYLQNWIRIRKPVHLPALLEIIHQALSGTPIRPRPTSQNADWDSLEKQELERAKRSLAQQWVLN